MSLKDKTKLLTSHKLITQDLVRKTLGLKPGSAANLLTHWSNSGLIIRAAPGCYISALVDDGKRELTYAAIAECFGAKAILVGGSAWERAGWCDSVDVTIAVPIRPSRYLPKINGVKIHAVGAKMHQFLERHSVPSEGSAPPSLHPIHQMLWWMQWGCPVSMPAPGTVHWKLFAEDKNLQRSMAQMWPELAKGDTVDVPALYSMIHMDRLTNTIPGKADDFTQPPEDEEPDHADQPR